MFDHSNFVVQKPRNATKKGPAKKRKEADGERKDSDAHANADQLSSCNFDYNLKPDDLYQTFESMSFCRMNFTDDVFVN